MKIKFGKSLRTYFLAAMVMICVLVVVAYSFISARYYIIGVSNVVEWTMRDVARSWNNNDFQSSENKTQTATVAGYHIAPTWEQVPDIIKQKLPDARSDKNTFVALKEDIVRKDGGQGMAIYHIGKFTKTDGTPLYISRVINSDSVPQEIKKTSHQIWHWTLYVGAITSVVFIFLVYLVMKSVSNPIQALNRWASNLNEDNIGEAPPQFRYKELNDLAHLIQSSLMSVRSALDREQELLRNCSHELRTPIAVIRNNLELLQKLHPPTGEQEQTALARMTRASKTMTDLTDTLIRLSHNENLVSETEPMALAKLIDQQCDQLTYLLTGKDIRVTKALDDTTLPLPAVASQVILNNLLRNAYQHTISGNINIVQEGSRIKIINDISQCDVSCPNEAGYGLGLKLCQKIAAHFEWTLTILNDEERHEVMIDFTPSQQAT